MKIVNFDYTAILITDIILIVSLYNLKSHLKKTVDENKEIEIGSNWYMAWFPCIVIPIVHVGYIILKMIFK